MVFKAKWKILITQTALFSPFLGIALLISYNVISAIYVNRIARQIVEPPLLKFERFLEIPNIAVFALNDEIRVVRTPFSKELTDKLIEVAKKLKDRKTLKSLEGEDFLFLKIKIRDKEFVAVRPLGYVLYSLRRSFLFIWIVFSVVSFLLGNMVISRVLNPIMDMIRQARKFSGENLGRRLPEPETHDEFQELAKTLNEMLDRIQKAFERQSQFMNDVSHELKTPLTSILGYSELALKFSDKEEIVKESLDSIRETADRMMKLIQNMLDLSKSLENLVMERIDMRHFLEKQIENFSKEFPEFQFDLSGDGVVVADRKALAIIVKALVENAIKFSENKKIVILRCGDGWFSVEDKGKGIPREELERIFDRFYKVDRSRSTGGYGLGLSIVKKYVEAMEGRIEVESEPGRGTKFKVFLRSS